MSSVQVPAQPSTDAAESRPSCALRSQKHVKHSLLYAPWSVQNRRKTCTGAQGFPTSIPALLRSLISEDMNSRSNVHGHLSVCADELRTPARVDNGAEIIAEGHQNDMEGVSNAATLPPHAPHTQREIVPTGAHASRTGATCTVSGVELVVYTVFTS